MVENPTNSYYWSTSFALPMLDDPKSFWISFHSCVHGGRRPKATSLWKNMPCLRALAGCCRNDREHDSWYPSVQGSKLTFPTHSEASYPALLCTRVASLIKEHALANGFQETVLEDQLLLQPLPIAFPLDASLGVLRPDPYLRSLDIMSGSSPMPSVTIPFF